MLCEHFTIAPIAFFLDKLISTDGYQFLELYQDHVSVLSQNITFYFFVPLIYSALILLRPVAQYTYTFHILPAQQRSLHMFLYLAAFFGYFLYVESASFIDLKDLCTFVAMAYLVPYT
jgi:hypothetical protein